MCTYDKHSRGGHRIYCACHIPRGYVDGTIFFLFASCVCDLARLLAGKYHVCHTKQRLTQDCEISEATHGMIWHDMLWVDVIGDGMTWHDRIRYDMMWYDLTWWEKAWYGLIWYAIVQNTGTTACDTGHRVQHRIVNLVKQPFVWHDMTWRKSRATIFKNRTSMPRPPCINMQALRFIVERLLKQYGKSEPRTGTTSCRCSKHMRDDAEPHAPTP